MFSKSYVKTENDSELAFADLQFDFSSMDYVHLTGSRRSMEVEILDAESKESESLANLSAAPYHEESFSNICMELRHHDVSTRSKTKKTSSVPKTKATSTRAKRKLIKLENYCYSNSRQAKPLPWPRWQEVEDIFLHGIVLDTYSRRHSLKPFKEETKTGETIIWNQVHKRYKTACRRHLALTGESLGDRTVRAIQKRWKHGQHSDKDDIIIDESGCFVNPMPTYKRYQREWDMRYNVNGILSCPEKLFKEAYDNLFEGLPETVQDV